MQLLKPSRRARLIVVIEATDREAVVAWFEKMEIPFDSILPVELEGYRGTIEEVKTMRRPLPRTWFSDSTSC